MMWNENGGDGFRSFYRYFPYMIFYYGSKALTQHIPSLLTDALGSRDVALNRSLVGRMSIFLLTSITCSLILMPLETIYYRLMMISSEGKTRAIPASRLSSSSSQKKKKETTPVLALATCVPLKPHYHGGINAFSRIWREEGIGAFYPLWSYRLFASCISQLAETVEISTTN